MTSLVAYVLRDDGCLELGRIVEAVPSFPGSFIYAARRRSGAVFCAMVGSELQSRRGMGGCHRLRIAVADQCLEPGFMGSVADREMLFILRALTFETISERYSCEDV